MKEIEINGYIWTAEHTIMDESGNFLVLIKPKKYNYSTRKFEEQQFSRMAVPLQKIDRIVEYDDK